MRTIALLLLAAPAFADATIPAATGPIPLEEALKGVKGTGPLTAKIEVVQSGKPMGTFTCELFEKQTPKTVANFVALARGLQPWKDPKTNNWTKKPLYDGLVFHRVIPGFMVQGGDPKGTGTGDPGYSFEDEFVPELKMDKGNPGDGQPRPGHQRLAVLHHREGRALAHRQAHHLRAVRAARPGRQDHRRAARRPRRAH